MLRHCVMFTWSDDVTDEAKAEVSAGLDGLASLPGVVAYRHGPDVGISDGNWDYVVVGDFETTEAYRNYAADQGHLDLIAEKIRPFITGRAAVQYEI